MWTWKKKLLYILYVLFAQWLPESRHMRIAKTVRYLFAKKIASFVGENANIERGAKYTPDLIIGKNSGLGINSEVYGPVVIGDNVMMGPEVVFYTQNHMHKAGEPFITQGYDAIKPVVIGSNVWIGRRAMFMPGSSVGDNVVVAAGSVVTSRFGNNVVIGGIPAKEIRKV